jgi:hypothetical protein
MKLIGLMAALFFLVPSNGEAFSPLAAQKLDCKERRELIGNARFEVMNMVADTCWLSIAPDWEPSGFYRSFLFDEHGYIMIFNSLGYGPESTTTGAREYMFFPRSQGLNYSLGISHVTFTLVNGAQLDYDGKALRFMGGRGIDVKEDPSINPNNNGGVELQPKSGLMIDFGFKLGSSPMGNRKGSAKIVDGLSQTCEVRNNEVLRWKTGGEAYLKFATDAQFFQFVRTRCPSLQF